ncbi:MAG TPA: hypothetical protein VJZ78_07760 [Anaerolineales bacterium]|nr:hypothetical protein [Anaerolineales bacterium]
MEAHHGVCRTPLKVQTRLSPAREIVLMKSSVNTGQPVTASQSEPRSQNRLTRVVPRSILSILRP